MSAFCRIAAVLLVCGLVLKVDAQLPLTVNITEDGDYTVSRNGTVWLQSAPTFFIIDSVTYSAADSSLTFLGWNTTSDLGYFVDRLYYYANGTNIVASVHRYNAGFLGFTVTFPEGANNTKAATPDNVVCGFPAFRVDPAPARLAYLSFGMSTLEGAVGRWENGSAILYGGRQGSGPLVLFDQSNNAIAMGPMNSFTVTSLWQNTDGASVHWGIMGGVNQLPAGFQYGVVMIGGDGSVNNALRNWGFLLQGNILQGRVKRAAPIPGALLNSLGYWTAPGTAYYAGPESGKSYEDTLFDVRLYAANISDLEPRVDYKHVEVDDWGYVKGQGGGVKTWTAPPMVFPSGIGGMANKTKWLVAAACGVWAADTTYARQNGGQYDFVMGDSCSLPADQAFWDDLFNSTVENKVRIFVQKDMETQYMCMTSGDSDVTTVMTWLSQLNVSTSLSNMEVLFSGVIPRLVLEAATTFTSPPVVQVGSNKVRDANHWKVGVANMFTASLRMNSFFGPFNSYLNESAPATQLPPMLYSAIATLSGGPVAVGDGIGQSNRTLIARCCNLEGTVLSPLYPAKAIDAQLQQMAWGGQAGSTGEVWTTYTAIPVHPDNGALLYSGLILAAGMTRPHTITPSSTGLAFTPIQNEKVYTPTKLFSYNKNETLHDFTDDKPFTLTDCTIEDFCLYYAAPVINFKGKEVVIMGEMSKWVPLSRQRVTRVQIGETIQVHTVGVPDEEIFMTFLVDGRLEGLAHRIGDDQTGILELEFGGPSSGARQGSSSGTVTVLCVTVFAALFVKW